MKKNAIILSLAAMTLCAAIIGGIYAVTPETQEPVNGPNSHEWARDTALESLDITQPSSWSKQDTTPDGLIGANIKTYTSGDLTVTVSHNLNPSAAFSVKIENGENTWDLWVNQDGTTQPR
ncbi:MAG: hypothetical protein NWE89_10675 [Candidatus Bathyarchaeota archaeon]|nr:hypothetical protein [Candidatus Bathyarchaeota archaeon]